MKSLKGITLTSLSIVLVTLGMSFNAHAARDIRQPQVDDTRIKLANFSEDLDLLRQEVGKLRMDLDTLTRENDDLKRQITNASKNQPDPEKQMVALLGRFNLQMETMGERLQTLVVNNNQEVMRYVEQKVNTVTTGLQKSLDDIAKKGLTPKKESEEPIFTNNYPKQGVVYYVEKGDTLSHIALKYNSTVPHIINANKISDPKNLKHGQTIFVPQERQADTHE